MPAKQGNPNTGVPARTRGPAWVVWTAACPLVYGASLLLVHHLAPALPEGTAASGEALYWALLGLAAAGLVCPWLALSTASEGRAGTRLSAAAWGVITYGGVALLSLTLEVSEASVTGRTLWIPVTVVVAAPAIALALRARRRRFAAALVAAVFAWSIVAWAPWARPRGSAVRDAWMTAVAGPAPAAVGLGALVLAGLCLLLWLGGARRRAAWIGAIVVSVAVVPGSWLAHTLIGSPPATGPGPRREVKRPSPLPDEWTPAEPSGPFKGAASDAVLGWRWANVSSGPTWREAVIVQPPCRLTGRAALPSGGRLSLFVALPRTRAETPVPAVHVQCTATDDAGREVGRVSRVLRADSLDRGLGRWEELTLEIDGADTSGVSLTLEARPATDDAAGASLPMLAIASSPPARVATPDVAAPNCVFVLVDALRADRLGCYGYSGDTSPRIDQLADEGTLFERVVSACSWTTPSVASLFTGTYVSTHGAARFRMPARLSLPTLAEQCRAAGIRTAAVVSNETIVPAAGFGAGFDTFVFPYEFTLGIGEVPDAEWVTDRGIDVLRRLSGQRFFLYLHYMDPHEPYDPPPEWTVFGHTEEERYLGEIRYCDSEIRRLLDELSALGRARDTLVVFIADHGEAFMEHGFRRHGYTLHREEVHVPLILRLPGRLPANRRVGSLVRAIDVHATVGAFMGLPRQRHVEGESLRPLLDGADSHPDRVTFSELHERERHSPVETWIGLDQDGYKLLLRLNDGRRRLYDVRRDPHELTDLASEETQRAMSMEQAIRQFLKKRRGMIGRDRPPTPEEEQRLRNLRYLDPTPRSRPATAASE